MQFVAGGVADHRFRKPHLDHRFLWAAMQVVQHPERAAVHQAPRGHQVVELFVRRDAQGLRADRRQVDPLRRITSRFVNERAVGVHDPGCLGLVGVGRPAVRLKGRFAARFRRDRKLHAAPGRLRQKHRLLDHEIRYAVLTGTEQLLGGSQGLFDVSSRGHHRRALHLVIDQIGRRPGAERCFEERVGPHGGEPHAEQRAAAGFASRGRGAAVAKRPPHRGVERNPMPRAFERIIGDPQAAARPGLVPRTPIDRSAADVVLRDTCGERVPIVLPLPERRQPGGLQLRNAAAAHAQQARRRADLDDRRGRGLGNTNHAVGKSHRVPQVIAPIARRGGVGHELAGQVRGQRHLRRVVLDAGGKLLELVEHLVHQRRVERVRHVEQLRLDPRLRQFGCKRLDRLRLAGYHGVLRTIEHRDDHLAAVFRQRGGEFGGRSKHDRHLAVPLYVLHQPSPLGNQRQPVFQAHDAGRAGRRVFADAVPEHDIWRDAPRLPQLRERVFQCEERRLSELGLMNERRWVVTRARLWIQDVDERLAVPQIAEDCIASVDRLTEHGMRLVEAAAHARILKSLARKQEGDLRADDRPDRAALAARERFAGSERGEPLLELFCVASDQCGAVVKIGPAGVDRVGEIGGVCVRMIGQVRRKLLGLLGQGGLRFRRELQQARGAIGFGRLRRIARGCFDDQVRVRAAEAERAHSRDPRAGVARPGDVLGWDHQPRAFEMNVWVERLEMSLRRDFVVLHHQHDFDQPRHAGDGLHVPDVGLHARHVAGRSRVVRRGKDFAQRLHFDRIAERRAGAVGFDVTHVIRRERRLLERGADAGDLGLAVRRADAGRAAVLVDTRRPQHCQHLVAVALGIGEPFQQHQAATFAADVAVGAGVERPALALGRKHAGLREGDGRLGREDHVHAARQRCVRFAPSQTLDREVDRQRRAAAGRVDCRARSVEVEDVREPVCGDRQGVARAHVGVDPLVVVVVRDGDLRVIGAADADEHAGPRARHLVGGPACVLHRLPRHFQ